MADSEENIIAIDGPAGSGKSTIAKLLAQRLGYVYVDTGAMYRALTLKALKKRIDLNKEEELVNLAKETSLDIINDASGSIKVMLDSEDVASLIRTPQLTNSVSYVAKVKGVREKMVETQRKIGGLRKCVFEGRDIGTVVFPNARYKFYLDADFKERANRRYKELMQAGTGVSFDEVAKDLQARDHKDTSREVAPLKKADDAIYIDTTDMSITEVVDRVATYIK